jgi:hypothetical protein
VVSVRGASCGVSHHFSKILSGTTAGVVDEIEVPQLVDPLFHRACSRNAPLARGEASGGALAHETEAPNQWFR